MRLEVSQDALKRGLATIQPAIAAKATLPVLMNVLFTASEAGLSLTATNLDIGIVCKVLASVEDVGAITIAFGELNAFVSDLPNERVFLTADYVTQSVKIVCGKHRATFKGIEADEFPAVPTIENGTTVALSADMLRTVHARVGIAAATENTRPVLTALHMAYTGDSATFTAADGFRLARLVQRFDTPRTDKQSVLLYAPALVAAARAMRGDVTLTFDEYRQSYDDGTVRVIGRGIEGKYPDTDRIIPTAYTLRIIADSADTKRAAKLAGGFARQAADIVTFEPNEDSFTLSARGAESGTSDNDVAAIISGELFKSSVNNTFLLEAIAACGAEQIAIETQSDKSAFVLRAVGDDSYLHIIMPMTVR